MVPDTPRELSSSCARKELIKVTGRSVGATCIFFYLSSSLPPPLPLSLSLSLSSNPKRLDPIQCSTKVLCNRSSEQLSPRNVSSANVSLTATGRSTSVNISDACSGRGNTCLINRIIRRSRGSLKVHLSDDRAS